MKSKILVLSIALLGLAPTAWADMIDAQLPYGEFGHLGNAGDSCSATSIINSFRFLENHYPKIYGNSLTGKTNADLENARDKLRDGYTNSDGVKRLGTGCPSSKFSFKQIWEAKVQYLEDFAPKKTAFLGMQKIDTITGKDLDTKGWLKEDSITKANPSFAFLLKEIQDGEDVEFAFVGKNQDGQNVDHMMTLTSVHFDDVNNNKSRDAGEKAWIDYLDPESPGALSGKKELGEKDGFLTFDYTLGDVKVMGAQIYLAYSESPLPVPEPSEMALLGFGLFAALGANWQRKRKLETH